MQQTWYTLGTFAIYFLIIIALCLIANQKNKQLKNYVLGGRGLSGPITALGVGASDMSTWLILALPGALFLDGLNHIWIPIGLLIGAFLNWRLVAKRLRIYTEIANDSLTLPSFFDHRFKQTSKLMRATTATIILIFFTVYCSASFLSGALLFQIIFHLPFITALWLSGLIILSYTTIGGFLAVNWIDFFQGSLMLIALIVVPLVTFLNLHHHHTWSNHLHQLPQDFFHPLHQASFLSIISLMGWGLGYFGQPHILMRFMAIKDPNKLKQSTRICMLWMCAALLGAVATGILGRIFLTAGLTNPEQTFLILSQQLFPTIIAGLLFSAVLSAMMSTVSAQLLASSSALINDFYAVFIRKTAGEKELVLMGRLCVGLCALVALILAANGQRSILSLVQYAWAGIGAAFGPAVLGCLYWSRMTGQGALMGVLTGAITVIIWRAALSHFGGIWAINEIIPGFLLSSCAIIVASLFNAKLQNKVVSEFNTMLQLDFKSL